MMDRLEGRGPVGDRHPRLGGGLRRGDYQASDLVTYLGHDVADVVNALSDGLAAP